MKPVKSIMLLFVACLFFTACDKVTHKKTAGGMPYQLYRGKGTTTLKKGEFIKVNYIQKIKDSVYFSTQGKIPLYIPVIDAVGPYDISELWTTLHKGDSVIATQMMDTFIKRNPTNVPPEFKNGDRVVSTIKIIEVFANDSLARADEEKEKAKWLAGEVAYLQKYLADKKVNAQKTPSGSFVEIINPGEGNLIDSGQFASVKYTGTSFSGKVFDSNVDTSFHHTDAMTFPVGTGQMIKGFDEAMRLLRLNSEARIYIPSMLAYGARPFSPDIKPFEHLIFDVKIVNVSNQDTRQQNPPPQIKVDTPQPK